MSKLRINRRSLLQGTTAIGLTLSLPQGLKANEKKVNFFNWDTYIGETTLEDFTNATGIEVQYDLYANNAELFAKLKSGNPGYDLIVPTNDYIERMIRADMLMPLDHSKIPNIANIDPLFMDAAFDPGRKYSLPYMWGTVGVGYRKSAVSAPISSWGELINSDKYSKRIALLSDGQYVFQAALKYMGKSLNDWTDENIETAAEMILKQKPHITAFAQDNGQDLLLSGEVDIAMEWNGDILQIMEEDSDINYVVPKEGALRWEDTLCIAKGGPNPDNAHALINFILDAKVNAEIAKTIMYATPNKAAKAHLPESYLNNPAIFPEPEQLAATEVAIYPGAEIIRKIDDAWTRVKSAG